MGTSHYPSLIQAMGRDATSKRILKMYSKKKKKKQNHYQLKKCICENGRWENCWILEAKLPAADFNPIRISILILKAIGPMWSIDNALKFVLKFQY